MVLRKKSTAATTPAKITTAAPAPVARSETKGSGITSPVKGATTSAKPPTYEQIAERAYQIYLKRGFGPGDSTSDWTEAERQLKTSR